MQLIESLKIKALHPKQLIDMNDNRQQLPDVLSSEDIENFEKQIGYSLPDILKKCYMEIGNGYFGPGYGLLPLINNLNIPNAETVLSFNKEMIECEFDFWKPSYIALVNWGCGIYSFMDLENPDNNIRVFDGSNYDEDIENSGVFDTSRNLHSFLQAWTKDIKIWNEMFSF